MAFKDGDFLEIDYSAWDANTKELIATTDEKVAKEGNLYHKDHAYGPALVILGSNSVIKGLDRELRNLNVNDLKKFTFKPADAFGSRSEDLVRVMPIADFRARDIKPYPGMQIELENMNAIVKSVNSGRVVVDANHPYADRDIIYEVKVVKSLSAPNEKVEALGKTYGVRPTTVSTSGKSITLMYDSKVKKNADYFVGKSSFVASILSLLKEFDKIEVKEDYDRAEIERQSKEQKSAEN